jgi:hypothetical protein
MKCLALIFGIVCANLPAAGAAERAADAEVTLTVNLKPPEVQTPDGEKDVVLHLLREIGEGQYDLVEEVRLPPNGRHTFENLRSGKYIVVDPWIWAPYLVKEQVLIEEHDEVIHKTIQLRVPHRVSLDVEPVFGDRLPRPRYTEWRRPRLYCWRYEHNKKPLTAGKTVHRLLRDEPYWFLYEPASSWIAEKTVGPIVPGNLQDGVVKIKLQRDPKKMRMMCSVPSDNDKRMLPRGLRARIRVTTPPDNGKVEGFRVSSRSGVRISDLLDKKEIVSVDVPPKDGDYLLYVWVQPSSCDGAWPAAVLGPARPKRIKVRDGVGYPGEVHVELTSKAIGRISVEVWDKRGRPLPDAEVDLMTPGYLKATFMTDKSGKATSWGLPRGQYRVTVIPPGPLRGMHKNVVLDSPLETVAVRYGDVKLTTLSGSIRLDTGGVPRFMEGVCHRKLSLRDHLGFGGDGRWEIELRADRFPILLEFYCEGPGGAGPNVPRYASVLLRDLPSGKIPVRVPTRPVRKLRVTLPQSTLRSGSGRKEFRLLFCSPDNLIPQYSSRLYSVSGRLQKGRRDDEKQKQGGAIVDGQGKVGSGRIQAVSA